jgi:hypothetical protein
MEPIHAFLLALSMGLAVCLSVCLLFRHSLSAMLTDICGGGARARFWSMFGYIGMLLATLWFGLWWAPTATPGVEASHDPLRVFVRTMLGTTFGLLGALTVLGFVLMLSIRSYTDRSRLRPPVDEDIERSMA